FEAPKLETLGGDVYVNSDAKFEAPNLETVGGHVYVNREAKFEAPKLESKNNKDAKLKCHQALHDSLKRKGLILIDGILSWILSEKTIGEVTAFEIRIVGKKDISFAVRKGNLYSHGETIEKAIEDLRYKISDRDASEFEHWRDDLDMEVSIEDAIAAYRTITGACETGVKLFVESIKVPEKLTPNIIVELTSGKYGNDNFKSFLNGEQQ
ncbi:MAG: hypothetical protein KDD61_06615, partial [Bdellovibrionales bacterium]|nr:hypothetical protein [Bdellovibrionales bacterium]